MPQQKREAVTVSFHYLTRQREDDEGAIETTPISESEFTRLVDDLGSIGSVDLNDEKIKDQVRLKKIVPVENVESISNRLCFGLYRAAYWGHAYDNTAVGKIPADSISLRPFYFLLYLSKDGRLFGKKNTFNIFCRVHKKSLS